MPRLGLASRGESQFAPEDVHLAIERGVRLLNWHGLADSGLAEPDAMSEAIASLGAARDEVVVSVQFGARTVREARQEWNALLKALNTDYVDVLTLYYVERHDEWELLARPDGALGFCRAARKDGAIRRLGLTSHQRALAADLARSGELDTLMLRYNAAHRGAESSVFPVTTQLGMSTLCYTATRWAALMRSTPDDPPEFAVPRAPAWYRFALQHPGVSAVVCAPRTRAELEEDLTALDAPGPLTDEEYAELTQHGARVRRHAGYFV